MKKLIYVAVFTASGFVMVSCDADSMEDATGVAKVTTVSQEFMVAAKEGDTIILPTTNDTDPGPGDDPIIVPPPPKP